MKKYFLLLIFFISSFAIFGIPSVSKACTEGYDLAGLRLWVRDSTNNPATAMYGVQAIMDTTNIYASTWDSAWVGSTASCADQAFVRISEPHWAWGQVGNGSDFYSGSDGVFRNASVANFEVLGGGSCFNIGAGTIGVSCDCNHVRVFYDMPAGYTFDSGSYDNAYGFNGWVNAAGQRGGNADGRSWVNYYAPGYDAAHPSRFILEVPVYNYSGGYANLNLYLKQIPPTPTYTLTVYKDGTGGGIVTDNQNFTYASGASKTFDSGNQPTLTATADSNSSFTGWSGDCSAGVGPSVVTMNSNKTCRATFTAYHNSCPTPTVSPTSVKQGDPVTIQWSGGSGTISSVNLNQSYDPNNTSSWTTINGVSSGVQVVPYKDASYTITVNYTGGDSTSLTCPGSPVNVTVKPDKSGSEKPVPPR